MTEGLERELDECVEMIWYCLRAAIEGKLSLHLLLEFKFV